MKNIKALIIVLFFYISIAPIPAQAQLAVVAPASDTLALFKQVKDGIFQTWNQVRAEYNWATQYYNETQALYNQVGQIQNQYSQIEQMTTALKGVDPSTFSSLKSSLQNTYYQSDDLMNRLHGMNDNVESIEGRFAKSYPTMEAMAKLDPQGWKAIVNTSSREQVDNIYNAKMKAANIKKMNKELQVKIEALSDENEKVEGLREAAQLGNRIALQQQQLALQQNENLALMLKQNADNMNNLLMLQQAMQLEASKTFKYTPQPVTIEGPGIYQIK